MENNHQENQTVQTTAIIPDKTFYDLFLFCTGTFIALSLIFSIYSIYSLYDSGPGSAVSGLRTFGWLGFSIVCAVLSATFALLTINLKIKSNNL